MEVHVQAEREFGRCGNVEEKSDYEQCGLTCHINYKIQQHKGSETRAKDRKNKIIIIIIQNNNNEICLIIPFTINVHCTLPVSSMGPLYISSPIMVYDPASSININAISTVLNIGTSGIIVSFDILGLMQGGVQKSVSIPSGDDP